MKNEYTVICKSEHEVQEGIRNLEARGFQRTANCYWTEKWETENTVFWVHRKF